MSTSRSSTLREARRRRDGPVAYVRFHGRNYEKWFAHEESWERYNYLYSKESSSVGRPHRDMAKSRDVYVVTNNHFRGQAIVNAGELEESLGLRSSCRRS